MKRLAFSTLTLSVVAALLCGTAIFCGPAAAQGYNGLIPDNGSSAATAPQNTPNGTGGYDGLIAPSETPTPAGKNAPKGYSGVMPGAVESPQAGIDADPNAPPKTAKAPAGAKTATPQTKNAGAFTPINQLPKMSYPKGLSGRKQPLTVDDLKTIAAVSRQGIDFNHMSPELLKSLKLPEDASETLNKIQRPRIDGMLPAEFAAKRTIDSLMDSVSKTAGDEARRKTAQAAYARLSGMADGYRTLGSVPDGIYQHMGVSDTYVKEEREGYTKALDRLHEAMEALQPLAK